MKRYLPLFIIFIMLISLSGCVNTAKTESDPDKITIVATNFVGYDFARSIVGDQANVIMLLSPGEETHSFDPTPADIIEIRECDIFLYVGGESDDWIRTILESMESDDTVDIAFMDHTDLVKEEHKEGMTDSHGHEHGEDCAEEHGHNDVSSEKIHDGDKAENEYDEHVWTSVRNSIYIVEALEEAVSAADPENEDIYHANAHDYMEKLYALDAEYREMAENAKRKWILFGDRFPFLYMMKEYGLDYYAAFPGCSSETEPNAATIAFLIDKGKSENVSVVLKESLSNGNIASSIAEEIGAEVMTMYACDNITAEDFENGETYISLMKRNLVVLEEALNGWH